MSKPFPVRPSLEQLKKQAKELLKSHKSGDPDGLRRIQENHPDWGNRSAEELRATRFSLGDAQLVIGREYGCASWPKLKAQVESIMATIGNPVARKGTGITWKCTAYEYRISKDGKRKWMRVHANRQLAYKPPGLYRDVGINDQGQICRVTISDDVHRRRLEWWPNQKKARLSEGERIRPEELPPQGPLGWFDLINEDLKKANLQWVETRQTPAGEINVFRHSIKGYDVWIDQKTKRWVEIHFPGSDVFDPETDPARHNPPEKEWSHGELAGCIDYDIAFDVELDDSLFRLEPPEGYVVENSPPLPRITEQDIIDYLNIVAAFNKKTFPDQIEFQWSNHKSVGAWFNAMKTVVEQKFLETQQRFLALGPGVPIYPFIKNNTEKNSFRYLGKGVKLGDKDRIVCWYKLKGARNYRVVYGDLTVKDLLPEALPLPVEP